MMKNFLKCLVISITGLLAAGTVQAHPGSHGAEGMPSGIAHMLGEHGYLLALLLGIGAILMRRARRI